MQQHYPLRPDGTQDASLLPWKNGVPATGTEGSYPPYQVCVYPELEILAVITGAGISPSDDNLHQLRDAIATMVSSGSGSGVVHAGVDTGTANHMVANVTPDVSGYATGHLYVIQLANDITGATDVNLDNKGVVELRRCDGSPMRAGDYEAGDLVFFTTFANKFRLLGPALGQIPSDSEKWHTAAPATGTPTNLSATLDDAPESGASNYYISLKLPNGIGAGAQLTVTNGPSGAKPVIDNATGLAVVGSEAPNGRRAELFWNGTSYEVMNSVLAGTITQAYRKVFEYTVTDTNVSRVVIPLKLLSPGVKNFRITAFMPANFDTYAYLGVQVAYDAAPPWSWLTTDGGAGAYYAYYGATISRGPRGPTTTLTLPAGWDCSGSGGGIKGYGVAQGQFFVGTDTLVTELVGNFWTRSSSPDPDGYGGQRDMGSFMGNVYPNAHGAATAISVVSTGSAGAADGGFLPQGVYILVEALTTQS